MGAVLADMPPERLQNSEFLTVLAADFAGGAGVMLQRGVGGLSCLWEGNLSTTIPPEDAPV